MLGASVVRYEVVLALVPVGLVCGGSSAEESRPGFRDGGIGMCPRAAPSNPVTNLHVVLQTAYR